MALYYEYLYNNITFIPFENTNNIGTYIYISILTTYGKILTLLSYNLYNKVNRQTTIAANYI